MIAQMFSRWAVIDSYGTTQITHSMSNAIDWLGYCSPNAIIWDRWKREIVAHRTY